MTAFDAEKWVSEVEAAGWRITAVRHDRAPSGWMVQTTLPDTHSPEGDEVYCSINVPSALPKTT